LRKSNKRDICIAIKYRPTPAQSRCYGEVSQSIEPHIRYEEMSAAINPKPLHNHLE
jgi:hypothetical protein